MCLVTLYRCTTGMTAAGSECAPVRRLTQTSRRRYCLSWRIALSESPTAILHISISSHKPRSFSRVELASVLPPPTISSGRKSPSATPFFLMFTRVLSRPFFMRRGSHTEPIGRPLKISSTGSAEEKPEEPESKVLQSTVHTNTNGPEGLVYKEQPMVRTPVHMSTYRYEPKATQVAKQTEFMITVDADGQVSV